MITTMRKTRANTNMCDASEEFVWCEYVLYNKYFLWKEKRGKSKKIPCKKNQTKTCVHKHCGNTNSDQLYIIFRFTLRESRPKIGLKKKLSNLSARGISIFMHTTRPYNNVSCYITFSFSQTIQRMQTAGV
jgi:hypothetical protein